MKILEYMFLLLIVCWIGCTFTDSRYAGMRFYEWENYKSNIEAGNYLKNCIYTDFKDYINYNYECNREKI